MTSSIELNLSNRHMTWLLNMKKWVNFEHSLYSNYPAGHKLGHVRKAREIIVKSVISRVSDEQPALKIRISWK